MIMAVPENDVYITSPKEELREMAKPYLDLTETESYACSVARKLRQLRVERGWDMQDLRQALKDQGVTVGYSTLYSYERSSVDGGSGSPIPIDMIPVFAKVYGYASATGWLPR